MMDPLLSLVIPCRDEASRLDPDAFVKFLVDSPDVELVMVDDGSRDGTWEVLRGIRDQVPSRVRLLWLQSHVGKGEAVRMGLIEARSGGAAYVGYWDADLAAPLPEALRLVSVLERDEMALATLGVRIPGRGRQIRRTPLRRVAGRIYAWLGAMTASQPYRDPQCGAKVFHAGDTLWECLAEPFTVRWAFDVELLSRLTADGTIRLGEHVLEVPLAAWREVPKSRLRAVERARALGELARLNLGRRARPVRLERRRRSRRGR